MTSNPMFEIMTVPFYYYDTIEDMMIEEAEPVKTITSLFELINNLPEDCSRLIYKKVMDDCIKQITYRVAMNKVNKDISQHAVMFYKRKFQANQQQIKAVEKKMVGLESRQEKCKNLTKWQEKYDAFEEQRCDLQAHFYHLCYMMQCNCESISNTRLRVLERCANAEYTPFRHHNA